MGERLKGKLSLSHPVLPVLSVLPPCFSGSLPDILQEAQVPVVGQDQCGAQLPEYNITSSMVCAGRPEGGVDSCQVNAHLNPLDLDWSGAA